MFISDLFVGVAGSLIIGTAVLAAGHTGAERPIADVTKMSVERPVAAVLKRASLAVDKPAVATERPAFSNSAVKPGLVGWHSSFAEACKASRRTHKPVLLFQLLGKLDHQFC
jgi:hypothetical protein